MKENYQRELDRIIEENQQAGKTPSLFLHSCCGPCSSYVLDYLTRYFRVTLFYYNPNLDTREEYDRRVRIDYGVPFDGHGGRAHVTAP